MSGPPAYLRLFETGALAERAAAAVERLGDCDLCARDCRADRTRGLAGVACRIGRHAVVGSFGPHFGEEAPISGRRGSGTIFFAGCNLRCLYCQNWELSWEGQGETVSSGRLAAIMLALQRSGCHNINLVSPSHVVAQILEALVVAAGRGLRLPIVWNTGGYDSLVALRLLDGVVDIYMPDLKYADAETGRRASKVRDYPAVNRAALAEMHRQVGDLTLDADGLAVRGLLIRHLVLPNGLAGTDAALRFVAERLSRDTYLNIMAQYRPCGRAGEVPGLERRPDREEIRAAYRSAARHGLRRLDGAPPTEGLRGWL